MKNERFEKNVETHLMIIFISTTLFPKKKIQRKNMGRGRWKLEFLDCTGQGGIIWSNIGKLQQFCGFWLNSCKKCLQGGGRQKIMLSSTLLKTSDSLVG